MAKYISAHIGDMGGKLKIPIMILLVKKCPVLVRTDFFKRGLNPKYALENLFRL